MASTTLVFKNLGLNGIPAYGVSFSDELITVFTASPPYQVTGFSFPNGYYLGVWDSELMVTLVPISAAIPVPDGLALTIDGGVLIYAGVTGPVIIPPLPTPIVIPDTAIELEAVIAAILRITKNKVSTFSVGGRQVAFEGVAMLDALYLRQQFLTAKIARAEKSNKGIRTRYGVAATVTCLLLCSSLSPADGPTKETLTAQLTTVQATMALQDSNFERGKLLMENAQMKYQTLQGQEKDLKAKIAELEKDHKDEAQPPARADAAGGAEPASGGQ
jgi:hypothetical protein